MGLAPKRTNPDEMARMVCAAALWTDEYVAAKWRAMGLPCRELTVEAGALASLGEDRTDAQDAALTAMTDELAERARARGMVAA